MSESNTSTLDALADTLEHAAIVIPEDSNWQATFRFVNRLLRDDGVVMITTESSDQTIPKGTFVIPLRPTYGIFSHSQSSFQDLTTLANTFGVNISKLSWGAQLTTVQVKPVIVGLYGGGGSPFNHAALLEESGFRTVFLNEADVRAGRLKELDVFIMPGGGARSVMGQVEPLGIEGCDEIARFVRNGGMYLSSCAGSYGCIFNSDAFYEVCPTQRHLQLMNARSVRGENPTGRFGFHSPGVGIVTLSNSNPDHPVMFGMPEQFQIVHYNGPVFEATPTREVPEASKIFGLATFAGFGEKFTPSERFHGRDTPNNETFLQECIDSGHFAIAAGEFGLGRVVAFGPHPEFGFDSAMVGQELPGRMLVNAVMWQSWYQEGNAKTYLPGRINIASFPPTNSLAQVTTAAQTLSGIVEQLKARNIKKIPSWMEPRLALSTFGKSPDKIWLSSLSHIKRLLDSINNLVSDLRRSIDTAKPFSNAQQKALQRIDRLALEKRPPEVGQDLGYQGVIELLVIAAQQCQKAIDNWDIELGAPQGPYDFLDQNPYQLVCASYMSAIGHVAGAYHLTRVMVGEWSAASSPIQTPGASSEGEHKTM